MSGLHFTPLLLLYYVYLFAIDVLNKGFGSIKVFIQSIHWLIHSIHSLIYWFIDSFIDSIHSLIHWFIDSLIHWFIDSLIYSLIHSLIYWFIDSLIHWFIDLLIYSLIHSLIYWFIHSFIDTIHSLIHWFIDSFSLSFFLLTIDLDRSSSRSIRWLALPDRFSLRSLQFLHVSHWVFHHSLPFSPFLRFSSRSSFASSSPHRKTRPAPPLFIVFLSLSFCWSVRNIFCSASLSTLSAKKFSPLLSFIFSLPSFRRALSTLLSLITTSLNRSAGSLDPFCSDDSLLSSVRRAVCGCWADAGCVWESRVTCRYCWRSCGE